MSNASEAQVAIALETAWGALVATDTWLYQRITGESLENNVGTTESAELTADRQPGDLVRNAVSAQGDLNVEWSSGSFDLLLEAAMHKAPLIIATGPTLDIDVTPGPPTFATFDSVATGAFTNVEAGMWLKFTGFINAANNGLSYVIAKTSNDLIAVTSSRTYVNETTAVAVQMDANSFKPGNVAKSINIEKQFPNLTGGGSKFQLFTGMRVNTWSLNIAPGQINTGSFGFLGKLGAALTTSTQTTPTPDPVTTTRVTNAITDVFSIKEGTFGLDTTLDITEISINLNNQLRTREAIANLGAVQIGLGTTQITGTINSYLASEAAINKFINDTESSLTFRMEDTAGNSTIVSLPSIKFTSGRVVAGGQNTDVIAELAFTAQKHATQLTSLVIDTFAA